MNDDNVDNQLLANIHELVKQIAISINQFNLSVSQSDKLLLTIEQHDNQVRVEYSDSNVEFVRHLEYCNKKQTKYNQLSNHIFQHSEYYLDPDIYSTKN